MDVGYEDATHAVAPIGLRVAAVVLDLAVALVLAIAVTAATLAAVISLAMGRSAAMLPTSPVEASLYLIFPVFEILVFTPVGLVAPTVASVVLALSWLSRRGILAGVSPGALILGPHRQGRGGSPS
jgi:hypothetical protein